MENREWTAICSSATIRKSGAIYKEKTRKIANDEKSMKSAQASRLPGRICFSGHRSSNGWICANEGRKVDWKACVPIPKGGLSLKDTLQMFHALARPLVSRAMRVRKNAEANSSPLYP
jgi:hypothetical protein